MNSYKIWKEPDITIHDAFDKSVEFNPSMVAVIDCGRKVTYQELKGLSDQLSGYLQNQTLDLNNPIGVFLPNSKYYLIACLSVLKLGIAYVNIEAGYTNQFIQEIIKESKCSAIITINELSKRISHNLIINLDDVLPLENYTLDESNVRKTTPDSNAFIGFTSGTTGKPKGIVLSHKAMLYAFSKFWEEVQEIKDNNKFGYVTYLAWDALSPLIFDKTGIIIKHDLTSDLSSLIYSIHKYKVNHVFFTPSLFSRILNEIPLQDVQDKLSGLKIIWLGGEIVKQQLINQAYAILPDVLILNNYGPSECFVVSQGVLKSKHVNYGSICNVGKILDEMEVLIFDDEMNKVGKDQIGFLYVSGPCLAKEYLNHPDLTLEKFQNINGQIYYATGDLAKILPDNKLMIYGRADSKYKPQFLYDEIQRYESIITNLESVKDCIVIAFKESENTFHLAAFVVMSDENSSKSSFNEVDRIINSNSDISPLLKVIKKIDVIPVDPISQKINYAVLLKQIEHIPFN